MAATASAAAPAERPGAVAVAVEGLVKIRAEPRWDGAVIGLFRAGQSVGVRQAPPPPGTSSDGCPGGWVAIEPRGFVCLGRGVTLAPHDVEAEAAAEALPDRAAAYPFHYGRSLGAPRYARLPSAAEQHHAEPAVAPSPLTSGAEAPPALLASPALQRHFARVTRTRDTLDAYPGMKLAWSKELQAEGRSWLLTPELLLVPKDRVVPEPTVEPLSVRLGAEPSVSLPLAIVLEPTPKLGADGTPTGERWPRGAVLPLSLAAGSPRGKHLLMARDGQGVSPAAAAVFERAPRPAGVGPADKWVEVRVTEGALVAYQGDAPVLAAVISPGIHGSSPGPYRTNPGRYRVSSKALTGDMGGENEVGAWRSREVPWIAYYDRSYALHGEWWHDRLGHPHSLGCINLAPADARWLFEWLEPALPAGWYAVVANAHDHLGTLIVIRR
jgi:hypothetical protein